MRHEGGRLPSGAHIDMTVAMLRSAGAIVEHVDELTWRVEPGPLTVGRLQIEPDLSNAAPFLAAAVVTGGTRHRAGLAAAHDPGRRRAARPAAPVRRDAWTTTATA